MTVMKVRAAVTWLGALGCLAAAGNLDFRFFVERVQPIFAKQRTGSGRCYDCHSLESNKALFHLAPFDRGEGWSDEASRRNFDNAAKLVTPGEPLKSRLLRHPLAQEAGGDPFHSGGKFWTSRDDPEFQTLADWVKGAIAK